MVWLDVAPPGRKLGAISSASIGLAPLAMPAFDVLPVPQASVAAAHIDCGLREIWVPPQVGRHARCVRQPENARCFGGAHEVSWIQIRGQPCRVYDRRLAGAGSPVTLGPSDAAGDTFVRSVNG